MFFYMCSRGRFGVIFLILFSPIVILAKETKLLGAESQQSNVLSAPNITPNANKARGIILKFKQQPTEKQKALVLKKTASARFQATEELELMHTFIFTWSEWQSAQKAKALCQSLSALAFVKYCEIDSKLPSDQSLNLPSSFEVDPFKRNLASIDKVLLDSHNNNSLTGSVLLNPPLDFFFQHSFRGLKNLRYCASSNEFKIRQAF